MKVLYADFNDFAADGTLPLTAKGSTDAIAALAEPLRNGEEVWLSDGSLWTRARVFLRPDGTYEARGEWTFVEEGPPAPK